MELKDKLNTPYGRLKWMLVMLQYSLGKNDKIMLADCYFSLQYVVVVVVVVIVVVLTSPFIFF